MFIVEFFPAWIGLLIAALFAIAVLFFVVLIISLKIHKKQKDMTKGETAYSIIVVLSFVFAALLSIVGHGNPVVETFDNPYSANEAADDGRRANLVSTKTEEVEKKISQSLDVDKVEVESKAEVGHNIINGNMTDFVAVEDGKIIDGKFYFTENTLEILVSGENDVIEHVSISTD